MEYDPAGHNLSRRVPSFGTKGDSGPRDLGGTVCCSTELPDELGTGGEKEAVARGRSSPRCARRSRYRNQLPLRKTHVGVVRAPPFPGCRKELRSDKA